MTYVYRKPTTATRWNKQPSSNLDAIPEVTTEKKAFDSTKADQPDRGKLEQGDPQRTRRPTKSRKIRTRFRQKRRPWGSPDVEEGQTMGRLEGVHTVGDEAKSNASKDDARNSDAAGHSLQGIQRNWLQVMPGEVCHATHWQDWQSWYDHNDENQTKDTINYSSSSSSGQWQWHPMPQEATTSTPNSGTASNKDMRQRICPPESTTTSTTTTHKEDMEETSAMQTDRPMPASPSTTLTGRTSRGATTHRSPVGCHLTCGGRGRSDTDLLQLAKMGATIGYGALQIVLHSIEGKPILIDF